MSYLYDLLFLLFIFSVIFSTTHHITSFTQPYSFFHFLNILKNICHCFWMITWIRKANNFRIAKVQFSLRFCLILCQRVKVYMLKCIYMYYIYMHVCMYIYIYIYIYICVCVSLIGIQWSWVQIPLSSSVHFC